MTQEQLNKRQRQVVNALTLGFAMGLLGLVVLAIAVTKDIAHGADGDEFLTVPTQPEWIFNETPSSALEIWGDDDKKLVTVEFDGDVTIHGDVNEAARVFWRAVAETPCHCVCPQ